MSPGLNVTNKTVINLQVEKIYPLPTKDVHVHIYTVYMYVICVRSLSDPGV